MVICTFIFKKGNKQGTNCQRFVTSGFKQCSKHLQFHEVQIINKQIAQKINLISKNKKYNNDKKYKYLGNSFDNYIITNNLREKYDNIEYINIIIEKKKVIKIIKKCSSIKGKYLSYKDYKKSAKKYYRNNEDYIFNFSINNSNRFKFFLLCIKNIGVKIGHCNLLIYDKQFNTIYRFDPIVDHSRDTINTHFKNLFENKYSVRYISFSKILLRNNKNIGPQGFSDLYENTLNPGTCLYWSNCIMNVIIENYKNNNLNNIKLTFFLSLFYRKLEKSSTYTNYIENYINEVRQYNSII